MVFIVTSCNDGGYPNDDWFSPKCVHMYVGMSHAIGNQDY